MYHTCNTIASIKSLLFRHCGFELEVFLEPGTVLTQIEVIEGSLNDGDNTAGPRRRGVYRISKNAEKSGAVYCKNGAV
jgi:hypothetical protein